MILLEAQKKFPLQIQTLELCKYVVAEMTPVFVEAVKAGKMKASAVQGCGGGMEDLLNLLLTLNDDDLQSSDGLSSQALRLGDEVRKSDEWLKLAKAIAELQVTSTAADPVRTEAKQQQVSLVQNIDGSAQNVKRDPGGKEVRRNYRDEVRQWMERMHLANNAEAAKRLGVSTSTLKSIMSNKGKVRYRKGTLDRVLAEISKSHR